MQNKYSNTGPKIFLKRLLDNIEIPGNVNISNPDNHSLLDAKRSVKRKDILIARLDGAYFYKFTFKENRLTSFIQNV